METMSYPCSPLIIPFPTHHEDSSYNLWSPQVPAAIPPGNGNVVCHADPIPCPDEHQDNEFMDMLIQEASDLLQGDPCASFDGSHGAQENNGSLLVATVQEDEFVEESSLGDLLVACARAVEASSRDDSSVDAVAAIVSRLDSFIPGGTGNSYYDNGRFHHAPVGVCSSFDRLACYFARGLHSRLSGGGARHECRSTDATPAARRQEHRAAPAYRRMLQELSPFIKFAHFTATQAILEATAGDTDVHVVDLNVGEGVQWASLMSDLARTGGKTFRLTSVVTADLDDAAAGRCCTATTMTARWLSEFAESLNLPFRYTSVRVRSAEDLLHGLLAAESCSNDSGRVIVSCDTTDTSSYGALVKLQALLLGSVRVLQPRLVVLIEDELFRLGRRTTHLPPPPSSSASSSSSFVEFFCEALHHFTAVLDALATGFCDGGYGSTCLDLVEMEMLGPRIENAVGQYHDEAATTTMTGGVTSRGSGLEGYKACDLSSFNVSQAKMLVGLFSRGFGVAHEEKGRLALCWNTRPLTSVSVWRPV